MTEPPVDGRTSSPPGFRGASSEGPHLQLRYHDVRGRVVEVKAVQDGSDPVPAAPPLVARRLRLELPDGAHPVRCLGLLEGGDRATGYDLLDNEILAGLRLARLAAGGYPREVSELVGCDADAADPYALFRPYRGVPVAAIAGKLLPRDRRRFEISLLTAVRWLGAAGIVHRALDPETVRWDRESVQITDFSRSTLVGMPREVVGSAPWWAPEQRPGRVAGETTDRDDLWAAGRLIHYVITGEQLDSLSQLHDVPDLAELLDGVFGPPERRPTARELLRRLGADDPIPRALGADQALERGRAEFYAHRARKHPETAASDQEADEEAEPDGAAAPARAAAPAGNHGDAADRAPGRPRLPGSAVAVLTVGVIVLTLLAIVTRIAGVWPGR
jgi:hypothetical protein